MRLLALVPYPQGRAPGQRYRIEQWASHLGRGGIEVTFAPFLSDRGMDVLYRPGHVGVKVAETARGYLRRAGQLRHGNAYDLAYVYREGALLAPRWLDRLMMRGLPFVFDFDDAIYLPTASRANAWTARLKSPARVESLCRRAQHVMVGNGTLAEYARRHARAVTVVPSTVDANEYRVAGRAPNARPIVGWTGSHTTLSHLAGLRSALMRLREEVDYELRVIGGTIEIPGVAVTATPWRAETEAADLRAFDIGLMPLPDDEWSRGKCGMKAIQYMAVGVPPVVSPVGFNATLVEDGVNGFYARTEGEWVDRMHRLLRDPELRKTLGAAARQTVEKEYTAQVQAPRVAEVFRKAKGD